MSLAIDRRAVAAGKPATTRTPSVIPANAGTHGYGGPGDSVPS